MNIDTGGKTKMLKFFEVSNFKGFKDKISLDLANNRNYSFNNQLIKNSLCNKLLIYGKNGSGKSNIGDAIFDLTFHLTDKAKNKLIPYYLNADNTNEKVAKFKYVFKFDDEEIVYEYEKFNQFKLNKEKLYTKNKILIYYDYFNKQDNVVNLPEAKKLNINLPSNDISILKYIYRNTIQTEKNVIWKMIDFVENMLSFKSLRENEYQGYQENSQLLADMIYNHNALKDFENFLKINSIEYDLEFQMNHFTGQREIMVKMNKGLVPLTNIASTGTMSMLLYFCWSLEFPKISFLFLDEFDAFYHYETSEYILKQVLNNSNFQAIITTHNTSLLSNELVRPDCGYIIKNNLTIKKVCDCTEKEIREAHNLEHLMKSGAFSG